MKDIQHNLKVSSSPTRVTWSGVSSHVLPWSTGASRTSAWRALHYSTCWCLLLLPELLPEPQKPRGDMCLFAKGTRSFFILLSKSKDKVDSVFGLCGEAELENAASQESERIRGPQFPVPRARPLASVHRCWDSVWMAAMTRLMKGKYTVSL